MMAVLVVATSAATYLVVRSSLGDTARRHARQVARAAAQEQPREGELDRLAGPGHRIWLTDPQGTVIASSFPGRSDATAGGCRPGDRARAVGLDIRALAAARARLRDRARQEPDDRVVAVDAPANAPGRRLLWSSSRRRFWASSSRAARCARSSGCGERSTTSRVTRSTGGSPRGAPTSSAASPRAFNRLLARAERATAEQQHFVADASHELRTPVTALQGHARIVVRAIDQADLEQARESAEVVVAESRRLAATLTELLSLAESGGPDRPLEPVRLDVAARDACDEMRGFHDGRAIDTDLAEVTVRGDAGRLGELIRILVDNALKYSPSEMPVTVTVGDAGEPVLAVRDRGPGLSETDRERALDRFYRGSASSGVPGSGLGLAIARAVCERHGAQLELQAAPGGGTVATVRFPAASGGARAGAVTHDPGSTPVPLRAAGLGGAAHGVRAVVVVHLPGAQGDPVEPAVTRVRDHDVLVDHDRPGVGRSRSS